jgi:hypothetical protein
LRAHCPSQMSNEREVELPKEVEGGVSNTSKNINQKLEKAKALFSEDKFGDASDLFAEILEAK